MLHGVPGSTTLVVLVGAPSLGGKVLLRPACSAVITVVRTSGTLTGNAIISRETGTSTRLAVTGSLVGALHPRVKVVGVHDVTYPCEISGTSTLRAVRASPFSFAIKTSKALAVVVLLTSSVVGAVVLT